MTDASGLSRRGLIGSVGAGAALALAGSGALYASGREAARQPTGTTHPFYGVHQAGITTAA